jgi:hypothetical protein
MNITEEEFYSKVEWCVDNNGCHSVISHKPKKTGYVPIRKSGIQYLMHRVVYELRHRRLTSNDVIMHSCDNPQCINIDHLSIGTHKDNMVDMANKIRGRNGLKKRVMSLKQYNEIMSSTLGSYALADIYKLDPSHIRRIRRGVCSNYC